MHVWDGCICACVMRAADVAVETPEGLLLTASADGGFAFEGGVFTAGSVVQWLRDALGLSETSEGISDAGSVG